MQFWDQTTGAVHLADNVRLYPHMPRQEILEACARLEKTLPETVDWQREPVIPLPAFSVTGGRLACVCVVHDDRLHSATFTVVSIGQRKRGNAEQQRALLCQCLHITDPSKDSKRGVLMRCPFGTALIATDPHSGDAILRLTYR